MPLPAQPGTGTKEKTMLTELRKLQKLSEKWHKQSDAAAALPDDFHEGIAQARKADADELDAVIARAEPPQQDALGDGTGHVASEGAIRAAAKGRPQIREASETEHEVKPFGPHPAEPPAPKEASATPKRRNLPGVLPFDFEVLASYVPGGWRRRVSTPDYLVEAIVVGCDASLVSEVLVRQCPTPESLPCPGPQDPVALLREGLKKVEALLNSDEWGNADDALDVIEELLRGTAVSSQAVEAIVADPQTPRSLTEQRIDAAPATPESAPERKCSQCAHSLELHTRPARLNCTRCDCTVLEDHAAALTAEPTPATPDGEM